MFSDSALVWERFSGPTQPFSWRRVGSFKIYRDGSDAQLDAILRYFGDDEERIFEPVDFPRYDSSRDRFFAHSRSNDSEQYQIDQAIASIEKKMQEHTKPCSEPTDHHLVRSSMITTYAATKRLAWAYRKLGVLFIRAGRFFRAENLLITAF